MQLNPYLDFDGNASEAIHHYAKILGGTVEFEQKFGEMPDADTHDWITDANRDRLAHGALRLGDRLLMVSDTPGFEPHGGYSGHSLQLSLSSVDEARAVFDKLAEGGRVSMPFGPTFWAKGFGVTRDRFGVQWMVNCEDPAVS